MELVLWFIEFIGMTNFVSKFNKFLVFTLLFVLIGHLFSCLFINEARMNPMDNWFKRTLEDEYNLALDDPF